MFEAIAGLTVIVVVIRLLYDIILALQNAIGFPYLMNVIVISSIFILYYRIFIRYEDEDEKNKNVYKYDPYDEEDRLHMRLYRSSR